MVASGSGELHRLCTIPLLDAAEDEKRLRGQWRMNTSRPA